MKNPLLLSSFPKEWTAQERLDVIDYLSILFQQVVTKRPFVRSDVAAEFSSYICLLTSRNAAFLNDNRQNLILLAKQLLPDEEAEKA